MIYSPANAAATGGYIPHEADCPECGLFMSACECTACKNCGEFSPEDSKLKAWDGWHGIEYCEHCRRDMERNARISQHNGELIL